MATKASFYVGGCSGSDTPPFPRPIYGHNTTAFCAVVDDTAILIDAGTGAKSASAYAQANALRGHLLFTHYHQDHYIGLPMMKCLFNKGFVGSIIGPELGTTAEQMFGRVFDRSSWPVNPGDFGTKHTFLNFEANDSLECGGIRVRSMLLPHAGGSVSYRIETPSGDIVVATDVELAHEEHQRSFAEFASDASLLYLDCQYRDSEYLGEIGVCGEGASSRAGWGHSTPEMIARMLAGMPRLPNRLLLGHHDPNRTDKDLHEFARETLTHLSPIAARRCYTGTDEPLMQIGFATEGSVHDLR